MEKAHRICPPAKVLLAWYQETLEPEDADAVQVHLEGCDACTRFLATLQRPVRRSQALRSQSSSKKSA
ncbi:MAG: zf-HC2 domain-containing protein [Acidobacteria bacterium]|nr:zf-HC2 domain-containing protein [Acidobacteriota bacterium]